MAGAVHQSEAINHTFDFSLFFFLSLFLAVSKQRGSTKLCGGWMMMVVEDDDGGGGGETGLIDGVVGVVGAGGEKKG